MKGKLKIHKDEAAKWKVAASATGVKMGEPLELGTTLRFDIDFKTPQDLVDCAQLVKEVTGKEAIPSNEKKEKESTPKKS